MATPAFAAVVARQEALLEHVVDVQDHNYAIRPKPGAGHGLSTQRSSRGGQVETFHGSSRIFANVGSRPRIFQALQMEGTARYNADRKAETKHQVGPDGDATPLAASRQSHYSPWLRRERNILCRSVEHPIPYPDDGFFERPQDNGERFYYEYALAERTRREANGASTVSASNTALA